MQCTEFDDIIAGVEKMQLDMHKFIKNKDEQMI